MCANPRPVRWVTAGYMVGPEEMRDGQGHCPMMVTVDVKVGEPKEEDDEEQESDEEGVSLQPPVRGPEEGDNNRWQQWVQQVHVKMKRTSHAHRVMKRAANMCGFSRPVGASQTQPKLQQLVAKLRKRKQEEVEARAKTVGAEWREEVLRERRRCRWRGG